MSVSKNVIEIVSFDAQSWLIAIASAVVGAIIGGFVSHKLTIRMTKERAISLTKGFYNEFEISRNYFVLWLADLLDEYRNPKRIRITEFSGIDISCIDSLTTELIASGKVISIDQRRLILSLKTKYETILDFSQKRSSKSNIEDSKYFFANRNSTEHLILESVEIVFYLSRLLKDRELFRVSSCENWFDTSTETLQMLGIKVEADEWNSIRKSYHENS